ncbi:MAG: hypothetical protein AB1921_09415 [Thermodesulfobacteriota bacterium]
MKPLSGRKAFLFKFCAVLLSLVATFLLLEILARSYGPAYHHFFIRTDYHLDNPRGYYSPLGGFEGRTVYGIPYGIDERGFRGQDLDREAPPPPPEKPGILALGDSFTVGMGVRYDDMYLNRLSGLLRKDGISVAIENRAHVAADIEAIYIIYKHLKNPGRFPITLYGFVLNDFGLPERYRISGVDFIDANAGEREYDPWRRRIALYNLVMSRLEKWRLHRVTVKAYQEAFTPPYSKGKFHLLSLLADSVEKNGSTPVVVLFPLLYDFDHYPFAAAHRSIREFCESRGIHFLDLFPSFSRYKPLDLWCHPTDFHPNELANKVAAEEIFSYLKREGLLDLLRREPDPAGATRP